MAPGQTSGFRVVGGAVRRPPSLAGAIDAMAHTGNHATALLRAQGNVMSIKKDFQDFVFRGNVVDLAVGVMIGAAFGKIVSAMVDDMVMPIVSLLLPGGGWRESVFAPLPKVQFKVGHFIGAVIDFTIVAIVLFFLLVKFLGSLKRKAPEPPPPPATRECAECLEVIPAAARRCKFCTSVVAALLLGLLSSASPSPGITFL